MSDDSDRRPSLRDAHVQATKDRILDALADLLTELHPATISVPAVARRSGVSVATIYRHFPTKAELFDRYASRNADEIPPLADDAAPRDILWSVAANFARREPYYRAQRSGPVIEEIRARRREQAAEQWYAAIDEQLPDLGAEERETLCRTLCGLFTPYTYLSYRDDGGLSADEAIDALVNTVLAVMRDAGARDPTGDRS